MTEDDRTPEPADQRDERITGLLDVEPLDELSRRRLVARALAKSQPRRPQRWWAVAAAAALVFAGGVGVLVLAGDDGGQDEQAGRSTTASRQAEAPAAEPAPQAEAELDAATAPTLAPPPGAADTVGVAPTDLGDLGNVSGDRLRQAVSAAFTSTTQERAAPRSTGTCLASPAAAGAAPTAVASGTVEGQAVVILIGPEASGSQQVTVLDAATCAVRRTVTL